MINLVKKYTAKCLYYGAASFSVMMMRVDDAAATLCGGQSTHIGQVADQISCEVGNFRNAYAWGSYALGFGFIIAGLIKIRDYVDDPSRNTMVSALIRLGVGSGLIILPFVIRVAANTIGANDGNHNYGRQALNAFQ